MSKSAAAQPLHADPAPQSPNPAATPTAEPATEPGVAPKVSVLVISYNTREMTLDCLRSLRAETSMPHEVIVIDNNSRDGSAEAIAAEFPDIRLVARPDNLGFAGGNNLAAQMARGEFLLLLNPDTVVLDHAIDRLLDFAAKRPRAGIWGGRTLFGDMRLNPGSCFRRLTLWGTFCRASGLTGLFPRSDLFNPDAYGGWQRDHERAVDVVQGSFFLIRRDFWQRLGGFDTAFFMYGEETDLCLRAEKLGAAPRMTPDATIIHYGGASDTVRADKMVRLMRAQMELIKRHFPPWQRPLGRALFGLWPLSRTLATRLGAALTNRPGPKAAAPVWAEVWRRRAEWRNGYTVG